MQTTVEARNALSAAWPSIARECCSVLGGELHYQAMVYHCLREAGVPLEQIGMNVKQLIADPSSELFRKLNARKHVDYRGGFEPIPDIVLFGPGIQSDWRRRNCDNTLKHMLLAIEVKASERAGGRLSRKEVMSDIAKLAAHREEVRRLGSEMHPVMMVIDVAPLTEERMKADHVAACRDLAENLGVEWIYLDRRQRSLVDAHGVSGM